MSLLQDSQIESSVYLCSFQCTIKQASISMKFPCSYFVQWSTSSKKAIAVSSKHLPQRQVVHFDQKLILQTEIVYNNKTSQYSKKETLVQLYLVSKSRPDQNKLVGRVSIDLAKVINFQMYADPTEFKLNFCSVQASITLQFHLIDQKLTPMKMHQLDKSSFIDYISQIVLKTPKNTTSSIKRIEPTQQQTEIIDLPKQSNQLKDSQKKNSKVEQEKLNSNRSNELKQPVTSFKTEVVKPRRESEKIQAEPMNFESSQKDQKSAHKLTVEPINQSFKDLVTISNQLSLPLQQQHLKRMNKLNSYQFSQSAQSPKFLTRSQNEHQVQRQVIHQYQDDKDKAISLFQDIRSRQNLEHRLSVLQEDQKKEVQTLKQEVFHLQKIILDMERKENSMKELNQHLQKQINTKNSIIKLLESQLNEKDNKCQELQRMLTSLSEQHQQKLRNELNKEGQKEIEYLQGRLKIFELQIRELNLHLQEAERKESTYEERFIDLQQLIKTLEFQNDQYKDELRNQLQVRQELESKLNDQAALNQTLQAKLNQILSNGQKKNLQTEQIIKQNQKKIQDLLQKHSILQFQNQRLKQINNHNQQTLKLYNQKQAQINIFQQSLLKTNDQVQSQNKSQTFENDGRVAELEQDNKRVNEQAQFLKQSLEMLQKQTTEEIQLLKNQNLHLQNHILQLQGQIQRLYNQLQRKEKTELQKENGVQKAISKVEHQIKGFQQQLQQAENKLVIQKQQNEELQFELRNVENEKSSLLQQLQQQQLEIISLKQELSNLKKKESKSRVQQNFEQKIQDYEIRLAKLNGNLEQQINQNNQLSQTILNFMQKEAKMKETLSVLEEESKEIFVLFQEKEHNQETYQQMIQDLQKEIKRLSTNFYQIHSEEVSPTKNYENSPTSLKRVKEKWQNSNDQLIQTNKKLEQLNEELNEELLKLKIIYNRLKEQSETQIKRLNQRILEASSHLQTDNFSQRVGQLEKKVRNKELQVQVCKSNLRQFQQAKAKLQTQLEQFKRQIESLQEQKFNIQSAHNQKDIRILQLQEQLLVIKIQKQSKKDIPQQNQSSKNDQLYSFLALIKEKLTNKSINTEWEQLIQNLLEKSLLGEDAAKLTNIQQKSRLLSKQLQKLKSNILKGGNKNQQEKLHFMNLIKTCESIIAEIINAAEALNLNQSSFL